ncbi:uncharacterized protein VTP21DRAFT_1042 [Calcarisporiella thermophila]|uniref:uncharacterized protein n=1 Tax=Calcarisporiella thermophila TaxID=911321 RepID=UPI00374313CE
MLVKSGLVLLSLLGYGISLASAHGRMVNPPIRLKPGDSGQGFTFARSPNTNFPCGGLPAGKVQKTFKSGGTIPVTWQITALHRGTCFLELSTDGNDGSFKTLKTLPNCADTNGEFSTTVQIPSGANCDKCTLRFRWLAKNTGETYLNCADIAINGSGSGSGGGDSGEKETPAQEAPQQKGKNKKPKKKTGKKTQNGDGVTPQKSRRRARAVKPRSFHAHSSLV